MSKRVGGLFTHIRRVSKFGVLAFVLAACSQGRRGIGNTGPQDQVWGALELCAVPSGFALLGCFDISINITENIAYLDVKKLGFNPQQIPYRVLARHYKEQAFTVLMTDIRTGVNGSIDVPAAAGHRIADYAEWRIEWAVATTNNIDWFVSGDGQGRLVAQVVTNWPELEEYNYYAGTSSTSRTTRSSSNRR